MNSTRSGEATIIALTGVSHALAHIYTLALPAVLILIKREFNLNDYHLGALATLMNFSFGLGSLPAGLIVDRVGSKRMLFLFLMCGGFAAVGVSLTHTVAGLACALGALGLACSIYHPAGLAILSRSCAKRGAALGIHGVGGSVGITIAPLLTGAVAALWGWRAAYAALGGLGFLAAAVLWFSPIEEWRAGESPPHPRDAHQSLSSSLLIRSFIIVCLAVIGVSMCFQGASAFLNMHISQQIRHASLGRAVFLGNLYTSIVMGAGILGQLVGGYVADRTHREEAAMTVAAAGCVPSLILIGSLTGFAAAGAAMSFAFFYFATQPLNNCLIAKYTSPRLRGAAFGLTSFLTFGVASLGAVLAGYVANLWGAVSYVFPTMAVSAAVSAVFCVVLWRIDAARRKQVPGVAGLEGTR